MAAFIFIPPPGGDPVDIWRFRSSREPIVSTYTALPSKLIGGKWNVITLTWRLCNSCYMLAYQIFSLETVLFYLTLEIGWQYYDLWPGCNWKVVGTGGISPPPPCRGFNAPSSMIKSLVISLWHCTTAKIAFFRLMALLMSWWLINDINLNYISLIKLTQIQWHSRFEG